MQRIALLVLPLLSAVALAGCSDGGGNGGTSCEPPACGVTVDPDTGKGAIVGVVLDETITPVAGATVSMVGGTETTRSDELGAFVFNNVEPGPHFVRVEKPGYKAAQQSVDVVANEDQPPVLKILLESDPGSRPYFESFVWTGFLECSAGVTEVPGVTVGGSAVNPCSVSPNSNNVMEEPLAGVPTFIQSETVWEGVGNNVGSSLLVSMFIPDGAATDGADDFVSANGPSPLVMQANETILQEKGVGTEQPLQIRVFPGGNDDDPVTVFVNQEFTVYTHAFYNFLPPEGWTFGEDGEPVVPE